MVNPEELTRKICDKQAFDALCILKSVNKEKSQKVENKVLAYFEECKKPIDFQKYQELVKDIDTEQLISVQRKNDFFGLDDITDI